MGNFSAALFFLVSQGGSRINFAALGSQHRRFTIIRRFYSLSCLDLSSAVFGCISVHHGFLDA